MNMTAKSQQKILLLNFGDASQVIARCHAVSADHHLFHFSSILGSFFGFFLLNLLSHVFNALAPVLLLLHFFDFFHGVWFFFRFFEVYSFFYWLHDFGLRHRWG